MSRSKWRLTLVIAISLLITLSVAGCVEEETTDPALEIDEIELDQPMVALGEEFTVSTSITNTENETGEYTVVLEKDGDPIRTETYSLGPGESKEISISHETTDTGLYNLTIGDQTTEIRVVEGDIEALSDIETLEFKLTINDGNETHVMIEDPATEDLKLKIDFIDQDMTITLNLENNIIGFNGFFTTIDFNDVDDVGDLVDLIEQSQDIFRFIFDDLPFNGESNFTEDFNGSNDLINESEFNETLQNETMNETMQEFIDKVIDQILMAEDPYEVDEIVFDDPFTGMEIKVFEIKINEGFPDNTFAVYR
ncbi:DUF1616 domain-containing protein [Methanonatronarchaeum sp. AMET6-2]|uniref:DUF1616 domain-containing protein n=1 Tax=Methanonatronarchaeum sp. AMET6-2 TaxID=2933293 RepID=UPI0011FFCE78|nr:DUF1616 domain-containing protein [Methanonatronarchaeum sp. AMET6-2]RZN63217.1 MAG: hypothetical protein EF811_00680 [Methanonatronarchaeia archaeon]UOY10524.1 DUF1616 domain-containing protein [Methanonatronarchaeum sp. AMET6-2]